MKAVTILLISVAIGLGASGHVSAYGKKQQDRTEADSKRDTSSKPHEILAFAGVKQGDAVLDLLGGDGYYSELIASKVGKNGQVVLHTNQAYLSFVGKNLELRAQRGGLDGVTQLVSEVDELKLGEGKYDLAILVLGYHDFFFTENTWRFPSDLAFPQLRKSLKPGGKLLIIDHSAKQGAGISVVKSLHRIEPAFVKKDIENRGFKFVKESKLLANPSDDQNISVFDPSIRRKADRFVFLFEKQ